jgi:DNA-binding MarR family transcriptional regulator
MWNMIPGYSLDQSSAGLTVIPRDVPLAVTYEHDTATLLEPVNTCQTLHTETLEGNFAEVCAPPDCGNLDFEAGVRETRPVSDVSLVLAETSDSEVRSDCSSFESLIELVTEAADSVRELMTPCLTSHGLNDARFTIMRAIRGSKNGECSQSELARCLKQSEANVSTLLDRMRGDGLVSREKSPFDRRRSVVRLTEQGERQLTVTEQDYSARARGVLRAFDVFEIQSFRDQLSSFIAIWESELELVASSNAVAGRIGGNVGESQSEGTETRHAQAG